MLNKVMLIGRLGRDPELRYTPKGTAVAAAGLATDRTWKNADGERLATRVGFGADFTIHALASGTIWRREGPRCAAPDSS